MALTPANPIVGGTILQIPAITSPDYVPGVSGWTIGQDGTVQFNSGEFTGQITGGSFAGVDFTINQAGMFFYATP